MTANTLVDARETQASHRMRLDFVRLLEILALLLIIAFIMFPIFWLALTSFKPLEKAYSTDVIFTPTLKEL